jgi:hypothetical protein
MSDLLYLNTTQLQRDDIVHVHGLRVLMDVEVHVFDNPAGVKCHSWLGLVLNPEDAGGPSVPLGWLYHHGPGGQPSTEPRWNVQGNELAFWHVERP